MENIPDKMYFKIGEVAKITDVRPYVLRYWESEFSLIKPKKSLSKQRVYSRRDLDNILEIKRLLHKERYTLEGAKKRLKELNAGNDSQMDFAFPAGSDKKNLIKIKKELKSIRKLLTL
ncbi:MAG: MerR family transcriptional regulator [Thermodesulfobacteriota bacterium]